MQTPLSTLNRLLRMGITLFYAHQGISTTSRTLIFSMKFITNSMKVVKAKHTAAPTSINILAVLLEKLLFLKISVSSIISTVKITLLLIYTTADDNFEQAFDCFAFSGLPKCEARPMIEMIIARFLKSINPIMTICVVWS
jgi:hypothetical protein